MRKFASVSVLILVAYIAGAVRHFETDKAAAFTDKVVAFVAPAVPHVTAAGDAVWSVVRPVGDVFAFAGQITAACVLAWVWLVIGVIWAVIAIADIHGESPDPFPSAVEFIWGERPRTADGRRTLPAWMVIIILLAAVFEFGARLCYFVSFTVATLIVAPLTFDMSRLIPSKKPKEAC